MVEIFFPNWETAFPGGADVTRGTRRTSIPGGALGTVLRQAGLAPGDRGAGAFLLQDLVELSGLGRLAGLDQDVGSSFVTFDPSPQSINTVIVSL